MSTAQQTYYKPCQACQGRGKKAKRPRKKARLQYQRALEAFERQGSVGEPPVRPVGHLDACADCAGSGLLAAERFHEPDTEHYPHVAIIGGGIGGVALAVALLHRGIPFTLYERDESFNARAQGYGLTLQQASKAIHGLGIFQLEKGVVSTRHVVHDTEGKLLGEWGIRKWLQTDAPEQPNVNSAKRSNVHISRQALRASLMGRLVDSDKVQWSHQLLDWQSNDDGKLNLNFQVGSAQKQAQADLVVGADGIRSTVRRLLISDAETPLRYLGCIVILGICPLSALGDLDSPLLDSATVFQTANGHERMYMMPYDAESVMWQLSFPMTEEEAKTLSQQGAEALKAEASRRTQWHSPIPQIVGATKAELVSGYPVYDREVLTPEQIAQHERITLIGDAAHPMSPFKGQGANQALLDALLLARTIAKGCGPYTDWKETGLRESVLNEFEVEMLKRSAVKVKDSAEAASFLHSEVALHESDEPRGKSLKNAQPD
ncbi:FAD-dependent monooxygenase [Leucothrix sargassi]|nr:FAD-dependent monooxygenase [Leucothrix sargassi]